MLVCVPLMLEGRSMIISISDILPAAVLTEVRQLAAAADYQDGKQTAGPIAREVKQNLQAVAGSAGIVRAQELITTALLQNDGIRLHAMPKRILPALFNRYDAGMAYGDHVDNALMAAPGGVVRGDISLTIFLSEPADYDGGELVINSDGGAQRMKLAAGAAVLYPSDTLHRVEAVTRGCRLAAVTWIQSLVRDARQRQLLAELAGLVRWAHTVAPETGEAAALGKIRANLVRLWADP